MFYYNKCDRTYDIFIVHGDGDRAWVNGYLKPMLGIEPGQIITRRDFDPTGAVVDEFVRTTRSSRYTALVLSPAFLADDWATFGQQLATFAAVEEGRSRFVVLILHECQLPLQLRYRVSLDCTNWEEWDDQAAKLRELLEAPDPVLVEVACPYPGMVPFRKEDARFFFGREAEVNDLASRLRHHRLLFVIGSSGSGKSSLVTAGLLPRMDDPKHFAPGTWKTLSLRPGPEPSVELARQLGGSPEDPVASVGPLFAASPPAQRLLVVVDQFEELYTQTKERAEQDRFLERLKKLHDDPRCAVLATMRADFYGDLMNSALWPVDDSQQVKISAPRGDALRAAIVRPAEAVGVFLEDGLVERLLADAADEPGMLPMLQEALAILWGQRKGRLLTRTAYDALGHDGRSGMAVAMATKADATLAQLPPEQQRIARRIFLRLVQFGEGRPDTRRQLDVDDLCSKSDDPNVFERVLATLIDNRLLIPGQDERRGRRVDISHEMLIVGWPASQEWAKARRAAELTRRWLVAEAEEWTRHGRGKSGLLDEGQVSEADRWLSGPDAIDLGVDKEVQALVEASREEIRIQKEAEESHRRRELEQARNLAEERGKRVRVFRRALAGVGVLSAFLAIVALYANQQRGRAERGESDAKTNAEIARGNEKMALANEERARAEERATRAQSLAFRAIPFLVDESRDPQEALGYSLAAVRASLPVEQPAVTALYNSVQDNHLAALLPKHKLGVEAFAWSPSSDHIATIDRLGNMRIWTPDGKVVGTELELGVFPPSYGNSSPPRLLAWPLAWSPDGQILVASTGDRSRLLWIVTGNPSKPRELAFRSRVSSLGWSANGQMLAVLTEADPAAPRKPMATLPGPRLQLFDRKGNWAGALPVIAGNINGFAWNPVSPMLASFSTDSLRIFLWQHAGEQGNMLEGHKSPVTNLLWAPDGEALASYDRDGVLQVWERGEPAGEPVTLDNSPIRWAWSPDGQHLAFTGSSGAKVPRLWSRKSRTASADSSFGPPAGTPLSLIYPQTPVSEISWDPRGDRLATQHEDQFALWTIEGALIQAQPGRSIHWHPKSGSAITSSLPHVKADPTLRHLNPSGREISSFRGHEKSPVRVAWSPDGRFATSAGDTPEEHVRIWDPTEDPMRTLDLPPSSPDVGSWTPNLWTSNLAWQPGGKTLVLANSRRFELRDSGGSEIPGTSQGGSKAGPSLGDCLWSLDGRRFLFLPAQFGAPLITLHDPSGDLVASLTASDAAWNPAEPTLATAGPNGVQVRDLDGVIQHESATPSPHILAWSPDGTILVSVGIEWPKPPLAPLAPAGGAVPSAPATFPSPKAPSLSPDSLGTAPEAPPPAPDTAPPLPGKPATSAGDKPPAAPKPGSTLPPLPSPGRAIAPPAGPGYLDGGPPVLTTIRFTLWSKDLSRKIEASTPGQPISRLLWSPDGRTLAATDDATALWLWSSDGGLVRRIGLPRDGIGPLAWSPDGAYLASVTGGATTSALLDPRRTPQRLDALVLLWDRRGEPLASFRGTGHDGAVYFVGWSPSRNSNILATAGAGRTVRLWTPNGEAGVLRGHDGPVFQVQWAPDGHRFATVSADRTIRIWDVRVSPEGRVRSAPLMTLAGPENRLPVVPSVSVPAYPSAAAPLAPTAQTPQMSDTRIEVAKAPTGFLLAWRPDGLGLVSVTGDPFARLWTTELVEIYALGKSRLVKQDAMSKAEEVSPVWDPLAPEGFARQMADDDPWVRARAAHLLGRLGPQAAPVIDRLREQLGDPDPRVRAAVAWTLARLAAAKDTTVLESLAKTIREDQSWSVRLAAIDGLSTATGERPPTLLGALASAVGDERLRPYATRVLRSSGKLALAALTPGVKSGDPDLAFGSLRVLDAIARSQPTDAGLGEVPPELIQALEAAGAGGDDRRKAAAVAVRISLLGRKAAEVEPIRELLASKNERARILALDLASQVGEGRKALIPSVAKAIMDDSTTTRNRALGLLAAIGESIPAGPGVSPPSSPTPLTYRYDLQAKAIESIGPELGPLVVEILLDRRHEVSYYATNWIGHLNDQLKASIVDELLPRLEGDASSLPLDALAGLSKSFASRVEPLLKSNRVEDRRSAVALAARLGKLLSSLKPQVEPLLKDDDPQTRVGAALALWKIDSQSAPKTLEVLRASLEHTDAAIRNLAIHGLGSMGRGAESGVEVLTKLVKDDPDPSVRDAARDAVSLIQRILSQPPMPQSKMPAP